MTRHQSSRTTKQRDKTAEHRAEGEPSGESVEHTAARTSSQGTDLHGWMLTKRFLGLFSGRRATLCVCSLPTGMRVCRWHSMRVRVSGKEKSNESGDILKFSYKINLTSQTEHYLNALRNSRKLKVSETWKVTDLLSITFKAGQSDRLSNYSLGFPIGTRATLDAQFTAVFS